MLIFLTVTNRKKGKEVEVFIPQTIITLYYRRSHEMK